MTYEELVKKVKDTYESADASQITDHIAFQFNIYGEAEGAFYLEISQGKVYVQPYEYYDRDVLVTTTAENLLKIAAGTLDPVDAYLKGIIRAEGNLEKAAFLAKLSEKTEEKPEEEKAVEEKPAEEKAVEEKPAEEKEAEVKPVEEKAAEVKPVEEKAAEEKAVEEKPVEEKEAEEKVAEEKTAEEKPAEDKNNRRKASGRKANRRKNSRKTR